jgi:hypothetical protein
MGKHNLDWNYVTFLPLHCLWNLNAETKEDKKLKAAEINFMGLTAVHSLLDHRNNEDIFEELSVEPIRKAWAQHKHSWLGHAGRTLPTQSNFLIIDLLQTKWTAIEEATK